MKNVGHLLSCLHYKNVLCWVDTFNLPRICFLEEVEGRHSLGFPQNVGLSYFCRSKISKHPLVRFWDSLTVFLPSLWGLAGPLTEFRENISKTDYLWLLLFSHWPCHPGCCCCCCCCGPNINGWWRRRKKWEKLNSGRLILFVVTLERIRRRHVFLKKYGIWKAAGWGAQVDLNCWWLHRIVELYRF